MTLRELRHSRKLTQLIVTKKLGVSQDSVSRLESRTGPLLSSLHETIEALGGSLPRLQEFPDRPPIVLTSVTVQIEPKKRTSFSNLTPRHHRCAMLTCSR